MAETPHRIKIFTARRGERILLTPEEMMFLAPEETMPNSLHSAKMLCRAVTLALALALWMVLPVQAAPPRVSGGARAQAVGQHPGGQHPGGQQAHPRQQPHLGEWIQNHQNLSPQDQQRALQKEPGFRNLPPQQQQRLTNRLGDLNRLPPNARQRVLNRTEALERLSPEQRQQVRGAMQHMATLPADRQRFVGQAFRELRNVPPDQRDAYLNNSRFRGQFSDQERGVLDGLFQVEPMLPTSHAEPAYNPPPPQ